MEDNARLERELTDVGNNESQMSTASERELNY
jgi:hypothetical protein